MNSSSPSQCALQCVVVVFETFQLQEVFGPLATLASGGQVGDLDGGGSAADRRACQVFSCWLMVLVQAGAAGVGLNPEAGERCYSTQDGIRKIFKKYSRANFVWIFNMLHCFCFVLMRSKIEHLEQQHIESSTIALTHQQVHWELAGIRETQLPRKPDTKNKELDVWSVAYRGKNLTNRICQIVRTPVPWRALS